MSGNEKSEETAPVEEQGSPQPAREAVYPDPCLHCKVDACSDCGHYPARLRAIKRAYPDVEWEE